MNQACANSDSSKTRGLRNFLSRWAATLYDRLRHSGRSLRAMKDAITTHLENVARASLRMMPRASATADIKWVVGLLLAALVGFVKYGADLWLLIGTGAATLIAIGYGGWVHQHFVRKDPDVFHPDFVLMKMAIKRDLVGHRARGVVSIPKKTGSPRGRVTEKGVGRA